MPKLSLYQQGACIADYQYIDNVVAEMYSVGGLDIFIHKYLGPTASTPHSADSTTCTTDNTMLTADGGLIQTDATQPSYSTEDPLFIEDLFLLENRNRSYEENISRIRGVYNVQDIDFDLSQFGLFLQNDTLFITFHYNEMIDIIGRKLMSGDVIEVPNLRDRHPLSPVGTTPPVLPKLYVIQDASFGSEGFSVTWQPHVWRIKATPLVGAQEYNNILNKSDISADDTQRTADTDYFRVDYYNNGTLDDLLTQYNKDIEINDKIIAQAEAELPKSGYDVSKFYVPPHDSNGLPEDGTGISADSINVTSDSGIISVDRSLISPLSNGVVKGYLTGDALAPHGLPVTSATQFPLDALEGDYVLRLDYFPNRLFRYNGTRWIKIEDGVRSDIYLNGNTQRSRFVNNNDTIATTDRGDINSKQGLSDLLTISADN